MESVMKDIEAPAWFIPYADIRTDSYIILAVLLGKPPSDDVMEVLRDVQWNETVTEKINKALKALSQAGRDVSVQSVKEEFNRLFVGLGCGEMVPYASWYREKKIQSRTLALLRKDLIDLGIVRQAENHESEDHVGALCEIMALIAQDSRSIPYVVQAKFFHQHIDSWMTAFFRDLQNAKSASFYRMVGLFGSSFLAAEREYLKEGINVLINTQRGGVKNGNGIFQ